MQSILLVSITQLDPEVKPADHVNLQSLLSIIGDVQWLQSSRFKILEGLLVELSHSV